MDQDITPEWLKSVGFQRHPEHSEYTLSVYVWSLRPCKGGFAFVDSNGMFLAVLKTRQDVRDLCKALGSPIGEND